MADYLYGKRVDPYRGYKFRVLDATGKPLGGFKRVAGLKTETEVVEYREGIDGQTPRKLPGFSTSENVILERGISVDTALQDWRDEVYDAETGLAGAKGNEFRRDVIVQLLDADGTLVKQWKLLECWPAIYELDDLDAGSSDVLMERVELANEGNYLMNSGEGLAQVKPY